MSAEDLEEQLASCGPKSKDSDSIQSEIPKQTSATCLCAYNLHIYPLLPSASSKWQDTEVIPKMAGVNPPVLLR
jgi:hypothetical protein